MDIDENDLLFSNQFIPYPEVEKDISSQSNEEFQKFYERERSLQEEKRLRESVDKMSIRSVRLDDATDDQNLLNTNKFDPNTTSGETSNQTLQRKVKEVITYVSVDSRDRNKLLYPKPSFFKIFLGKTFYNVKSIRLASMEFPNTNAVVNSYNNKIYWRNQEDIDKDKINNITKQYPIYETTFRIGSYVATSLQTEMSSKLALVKRLDNSGDYHYFIVNLDLDTDVVTFTSLVLTQLNVNALSTTANTGIIKVGHANHGLSTGDQMYLVGAQALGGIPSSYLNTIHTVVVDSNNSNSANEYFFEVPIKAAQKIDNGGGNTLKVGKIAPYQFLFGDYNNTIAPNIGFPLENSSQLIKTYIKSVNTIYQVVVRTAIPHNLINTLSNDLPPIHLGKRCTIRNSGTSPNIDGDRTITKIIDQYTFVIQVNNPISIVLLNNAFVEFDPNIFPEYQLLNTFNITSISNYDFNTLLITNFSTHNYDISHIGKNVILYNTQTVPVLDGTHKIDGIFSLDSFTIIGSIFANYTTSTNGQGGYISRNHPLKTYTTKITGVTTGSITTLSCPNHNLLPNDTIKIYDLVTTPNINTNYQVYSTPNSNTITLNTLTQSIDISSLSTNDVTRAYIGTGLHTVSFPNHGFNKIISIQNTTGFPTGFTYGNLFVVQTQLNHGFSDDQIIRLSGTPTSANLNLNVGHKITVKDSDEFIIGTTVGSILPSPITSGFIGFNQEFQLYNIKDIAGISSININNKKYSVRNILDENTFTFYSNNLIANATESGGGDSGYISSLIHGFNGQQKNLRDNLLNRSINLQGENYTFLCCPQLSTMMNTGNVKNVFARIILDQSPGSMVFSYLSNPKIFDNTPLDSLSELEFSMLNWDNTFYEFNDLDYAFTLQITELIDITDGFNVSSRRGIVDNSNLNYGKNFK